MRDPVWRWILANRILFKDASEPTQAKKYSVATVADIIFSR
jgi:hypothetical protein